MPAMQVTESYEACVKLFKHLHKSRQGDRLISIAQNGIALGKIKKLKCNGSLFCSFICAYWACHMKWIHRINEVSNKFGHSSPLTPIRLTPVLDDLQEVKTMQSSIFENYEKIREGLSADDHKNCVYCKDTSKKQANYFFE